MRIHRRNFLQLTAGIALTSSSHIWAQKPQTQPGIFTKVPVKIGYWPIVAGLPLYLALEKGYFKQAGLNVEAVKFSGEKEVVEGLMTGQIQGAANGVSSGDLATGEISSPSSFKIIAANTIGGTLNSPWFGGSAALSTQFYKQNLETAKNYIDVYRRAVISIREHPEEARQYLKGYTGIEEKLTKLVPLPEYRLYDEFTVSDIEYFQKFLNLLHENKGLTRKVEVASLILKDFAIA